jgi:hypothetical protein
MIAFGTILARVEDGRSDFAGFCVDADRPRRVAQ